MSVSRLLLRCIPVNCATARPYGTAVFCFLKCGNDHGLGHFLGYPTLAVPFGWINVIPDLEIAGYPVLNGDHFPAYGVPSENTGGP